MQSLWVSGDLTADEKEHRFRERDWDLLINSNKLILGEILRTIILTVTCNPSPSWYPFVEVKLIQW